MNEKKEALKKAQVDTNELFKKYAESRKFQEAKDLINSGPNQPDADTVSLVFKSMCTSALRDYFEVHWDFVRFLGDMEGDNKPNKEAIDYAVSQIMSCRGVQPLLNILCDLKSVHAPNQKIFDDILFQKVVELTDSHPAEPTWVEILCMSTVNMPSKEAVNKAFLKISDIQKSRLLITLCQMRTDNKPNQEAIHYALQKAVTCNDKDVIDTLCLMDNTDNKPSQEALNVALISAVEAAVISGNWDIVQALSSSKNKADLPTVEAAAKLKAEYRPQIEANGLFKQYVAQKDWSKAKEALSLEILPSREMISQILSSKAPYLPESLIKILCTLDENYRADKNSVALAVMRLADFLQFDAPLETDKALALKKIAILCSLEQDNKLDSEAISDILEYAVHERNWRSVEYFCGFTSENKPSEASVCGALRAGVRYENIKLLEIICGREATAKPKKTALNRALLSACQLKTSYVAEYLYKVIPSDKLDEETKIKVKAFLAPIKPLEKMTAQPKEKTEEADKRQKEVERVRKEQEEAARTQQKQSLEKINKILAALETKIKELEKGRRQVRQAATALLAALKTARDAYQTALEQPARDACKTALRQNAQKTFRNACSTAIEEAKPILEKNDLSWGAYLTKMLKALVNAVVFAVTLGNKRSFFVDTGPSLKSQEVLEQAKEVLMPKGQ